MFRHPERDCIYQESTIVKEFGYERPAIVDLQMACYRARGYPEHNGLNLGGVIFRRHHDPTVSRWSIGGTRSNCSASAINWG